MAAEQFCKKCVPEQKFSSFDDLLRHTRSYHRKQTAANAAARESPKKKKAGNLCESCGRTVAARFMSRHVRFECPKLKGARPATDDQGDFGRDDSDGNDSDGEGGKRKKYVPVKMDGICPYCEFKFADLLGHLR